MIHNKIIIVVDMQNDFVTGPLGTKEAQTIVPKIAAYLKDQISHPNVFPIFTKDIHNTDYLTCHEGKLLPVEHCINGTDGWKIVNELSPYNIYRTVRKNSFGSSAWPYVIEGIEDEMTDLVPDYDITLCGVCTDICVISNALILRSFFPEKDIYVKADLCAGSTPEKHLEALDIMKSCQIQII